MTGRQAILGSLVLVTQLGACYQAELDPEALGVYVCEQDSDCALGSACIDGVCDDPDRSDDIALVVQSPAPLDVFPLGSTGAVPLTIGGRGVVLTAALDDAPEAGYIEISLDGALVDTITEGDLEAGIELDSVAFPREPGLHHIRLEARSADGEPLGRDGVSTSTAFWMDDGQEHVGILDPAPGTRLELTNDTQLAVEVASLNFTFANPGFSAPEDLQAERLGYVSLFLNTDIPSCLPDCNFDYQTTIVPAGLSRVNRIKVEQVLDLPEEIGTTQVQIVAQTMANAPYHREAGAGELVYHMVPVQSVVRVAP